MSLGIATSVGLRGLAAAANPQAPQPAPPASTKPADEPKETFWGGVGREAKETALKVGNVSQDAVGGFIGLSAGILGLYAGVAGGAIFLGALGAGLGPIVASVSTHGLLSFIGTSFHTMTFWAKAGVVVGGLSTGVGAFQVGRGLGSVVGAVPGMIVGGAIGTVMGIIHQTQKKLGGDGQ